MLGGPDGTICGEPNGCSIGETQSDSDGPAKEAALWEIDSNPSLEWQAILLH
jgi:hypothetical protein